MLRTLEIVWLTFYVNQIQKPIAPILRMLAKKGVYDVFLYIKDHDRMHYNGVLAYLLDNNIIKSRSAVTTILQGLTQYELLERIVNENPLRVYYSVSEKGFKMIKHLKEIEKISKIK